MDENNINSAIEKWERNKRFWYNFYLFVGVGINFLIYFTKPYGFDPGQSVPLGATVGFLIPLATMVVCSKIHGAIVYRKQN